VSTNHAGIRYSVFFSAVCYFIRLGSKYFPWHCSRTP